MLTKVIPDNKHIFKTILPDDVNLLFKSYCLLTTGFDYKKIQKIFSEISIESLKKENNNDLLNLYHFIDVTLKIKISFGLIDHLNEKIQFLVKVNVGESQFFEANLRILITDVYKQTGSKPTFLQSLQLLTVRCDELLDAQREDYEMILEANVLYYRIKIVHLLLDYKVQSKKDEKLKYRRNSEFPYKISGLTFNLDEKDIIQHNIGDRIDFEKEIETLFNVINNRYEEAIFLHQLLSLNYSIIELKFHYARFLATYSNPDGRGEENELWWEKWWKDHFLPIINLQNTLGIDINKLEIYAFSYKAIASASQEIYTKKEISNLCNEIEKNYFPPKFKIHYFSIKWFVYVNHSVTDEECNDSIDAGIKLFNLLKEETSSSNLADNMYLPPNIILARINIILFLVRDYLHIGKHSESNRLLKYASRQLFDVIGETDSIAKSGTDRDELNNCQLLCRLLQIEYYLSKKINCDDAIKDLFIQKKYYNQTFPGCCEGH